MVSYTENPIEYRREYYLKNKEKIDKANTENRIKNYISNKNRKKNYFENNKNAILERAKKVESRKCHKAEYDLRYRKENWHKQLFNRCRKSNVRHFNKLECDFDAQYIMDLYEKQNGKCHWLGVYMNREIIEGFMHPFRPSIDRLDNDKGYSKDNIVLCCCMANLGRNLTNVELWKACVENLKETMKNS